MLTNKQRYKIIVEDFLLEAATYLQQFDSKKGSRIAIGRKTYDVSHFDCEFPFKESPKKVRELDILTLRDRIRRYQFHTDNVVVFISDKRRMKKVNYNQIYA